MQIAILDDYQNMALSLAPWRSLPPEVRATSFHDTLREEAAVAERLRPFEIIVAMRERTPFPRTLARRSGC